MEFLNERMEELIKEYEIKDFYKEKDYSDGLLGRFIQENK